MMWRLNDWLSIFDYSNDADANDGNDDDADDGDDVIVMLISIEIEAITNNNKNNSSILEFRILHYG